MQIGFLSIFIALIVFSNNVNGEEISAVPQGQTGNQSSVISDAQEASYYSEYILGHWRDLSLSEKVEAILGTITWIGSYAGYYMLAAAGGGPLAWVIIVVILFYISCFLGATCLGHMLE